MANITGSATISPQLLTEVSTTAQVALGTRVKGTDGNEYIYLKGVASTVAGDWVSFDNDFATTRLVGSAVGPVAIAQAAIVADRYGWYAIYGVVSANTDTVAADKQLYIDGTAGRADDANVAGDLILGAYSMTADTSNVATVHITYPSVTDVLGS